MAFLDYAGLGYFKGKIQAQLDNKKDKQTAVSSPSADGSTSAFIDTISQNANGVITPTKKNVYGSDIAMTSSNNQKVATAVQAIQDWRPSGNGTSGQVLYSNGNGTTTWGAAATSQDVATAVQDWMDNHMAVNETITLDDSLTQTGSAAQAAAAGNQVLVADSQPSASTNKIWIKQTPEDEIEIPTMDEFNDLKSAFNREIDETNNEKIFDNYVINDLDFDLGGIGASSAGWWWYASTTRVRSKEGVYLTLKKNDVIKLTDYTDAKFMMFWHEDGQGKTSAWIQSGYYTVPKDYQYAIMIMNKTEATQTSIYGLLNLLVIESVEGRMKLLEKSVSDEKDFTKLNVMRYVPEALDVKNVSYNNYLLTNLKNILFRTDSVAVTSSGVKWCGIQTKFKPEIGRTLYVKASRSNGGNGFICRIRAYDSNNQLIGFDTTSSANGVAAYKLIPSNCAYCEVTIAIAWGTAVAEDTVITLSDIEMWYDKEMNPEDYPLFLFENKGGKSITFSDYINNVDNMLFCCSNIECISSTTSYEGITLTFKPLIKGRYLCFKATSDYTPIQGTFAYRMFTYDSNDTQIGYSYTAEFGKEIKLFIGSNVAKVHIDVATNWTTSVSADVEYNISDIELFYDDGFANAVGVGNYNYSGKAKLTLKNNKYLMKMQDIKTYLQSDWTTLTGDDYGSNQSMAINGNWIFLLNDSAGSIAYDRVNDESYSFSFPNGYHHNSAQFLDVYYDSDDEFPLLMVSNCEYNITEATISVVRITRTGTEFTATLVKTIVFNIDAMKNYGFSAVFDSQKRKLIAYYNTKGTWHVYPDNPVNMSEFDEPNWTSSDTVTYTVADEKVLNTFPFFIVQGMTYFNGMYFIGSDIPSSAGYYPDVLGILGDLILVFNTSGELMNVIPTNHNEAEGVAIDGGSLYLSARDINQSGTTTNTVCWIAKFDFD